MILVHADESCLGNQNSTPSRGGAAALVEVSDDGKITRWDFYLSSPDTTNNRMALIGAHDVLERLPARAASSPVIFYSDSQYLVKGMNEWLPSWKARGWRRRAGAIENLELWKKLDGLARGRNITFRWVRGHAGNAKNEYADFLAVQAAELQVRSDGLEPSRLEEWLASKQQKGHFTDYDADAHFHQTVGTPTRR